MNDFVSEVVLGEHELSSIARRDPALTIYRSRSTVDGGIYTVFLLRQVRPTSGATEIAGAAARASRLALGQPGVLPVLAARVDRDHTWVVRRGEPGDAVSDLFGQPRRFDEVHQALLGPGKALMALHDVGQLHGALSPALLVTIDGRAQLDGTGLSLIAEASAGTRALRDVIPPSFRPPELASEVPSSVGPWSDVYAFARITLALLRGETTETEPETHAVPHPERKPESVLADFSDLDLPAPLEKVLRASLAPSAAARPSDVGPLLDALASAGARHAQKQAVPVVASRPVHPTSDEPAAAPPARDDTVGPAEAPPEQPHEPAPTPTLEPAAEPAPPPKPAAKSRDPLATLVLVTGVFSLLGFVAVSLGAGAYVYRDLTSSPTAPTATPITPAPIAVPPPTPGPTPSPTATSTAPGKPPLAFAPRPAGEITTSADDADALLPVLADDPVRGDKHAPVTLVVFADLTCPHSLRLLQSLPEIESAAASQLRVVVKLYPLPDRESADDAAEAALAVYKKGGTDAFFKFLLQVAKGRGVRSLDPGSLEQSGIRAGAPAGAVTEALRTHASKRVLEANIVQGRKMAVVATPVVFVNGRRFDGLRAPSELEAEIRAEATRARTALTRGTPPDRVYRDRVLSNVTTAEADGDRR